MTKDELVIRYVDLALRCSEILSGLHPDPDWEKEYSEAKKEMNEIRAELGMEPV